MNQHQKIIELLSDYKFHCTSEMAALYMVDYRRRLVDLKEKGYHFENRKCTQHNHPMKEWKLISEPSQTQETAPITIIPYPKHREVTAEYHRTPETLKCCVWAGKNGIHSSTCSVPKLEKVKNTLF